MKSGTFARSFVWATVAVTGLSACGIFDSSNGKSDGPQSTANGIGVTPGVDGAAGCSGMPGPAMVELAAPNGVKYCIDTTEVSQSQYAEFLSRVSVKPGTEHGDCAGNSTYQPLANPIDSIEPKNCPANLWSPTSNRPVVCIDWCDAYAYCAWAGKRLCGKVGGGRTEATTGTADVNPMLDATVSQWFNACSQGGKTVYPYGDEYDPLACAGHDAMKDPSSTTGHLPTENVGTRSTCVGDSEPFASIRDLSGSVEEFTDECRIDQISGLSRCSYRGGQMADTPDHLTCSSGGGGSVSRHQDSVGFRCCKDLP